MAVSLCQNYVCSHTLEQLFGLGYFLKTLFFFLALVAILALFFLKTNSGATNPKSLIVLAGSLALALFLLLGIFPDDTPRRNIVLVHIDLLNPSRLGLNGNVNSPTPFLDGLASKGAYFSEAYSPTPLTFESDIAVLTGVLPSATHKYYERPPPNCSDSPDVLSEYECSDGEKSQFKTDVFLPAILSKMGYRTAAFIDQEFGKKSPYELGFSEYFRITDAEPPFKVSKWLSDSQNRPSFAFVKITRLHFPRSSAPGASKYTGSNESVFASIPGVAFTSITWDPSEKRFFLESESGEIKYVPREDIEFLKNEYDGVLSEIDSALERVFSEIPESVLNRTSIIITSEHSEMFGDPPESYFGHGKMDKAGLHVPLIVISPDVPPGNSSALLSTLELYQGILSIATEGARGTTIGSSGNSMILAEKLSYGEHAGYRETGIISKQGDFLEIFYKNISDKSTIESVHTNDPDLRRDLVAQLEMLKFLSEKTEEGLIIG